MGVAYTCVCICVWGRRRIYSVVQKISVSDHMLSQCVVYDQPVTDKFRESYAVTRFMCF